MLTGNDDVKFVYANEVRNWIYNDNGNFLGVDETNGDVAGTTNYTFTTDGLLSTSTSTSYGDPHHDNDDIETTTTYVSNTLNGKWLNLPSMVETSDTIISTPDEDRISRKTITYNENGNFILSHVF